MEMENAEVDGWKVSRKIILFYAIVHTYDVVTRCGACSDCGTKATPTALASAYVVRPLRSLCLQSPRIVSRRVRQCPL